MRLRRWRSASWSRFCALLAASWLVVAFGAPLALRAAIGAESAARAADARMAERVGGMPGMSDGCAEMRADGTRADGTRAAGGRAAPGDHGDGGHRCCLCFGSCCHGAPAVPARAPAASFVVVLRALPRPARVAAVVVSYRPTAPEHARPPSVGPPAGPAS